MCLSSSLRLCLLPLLLLSASNRTTGAQEPGDVSAVEPASVNAAAPDALGVKVELVDPGSESRRTVRFTPQAGDKVSVEMVMQFNQQVSIAGNKLPSPKLPPQKMTIALEVTDVAANGDISFVFEYTDMQVVKDPENPAPMAAMIQAMLDPMIGATGTGLVSNRGLTQKGELEIPENLNPQLKQMLEGMQDAMNRISSPVPAEPVGQGAKWRVIQTIDANGVRLVQTSNHEIESIDADGFVMGISIEQDAQPQVVQSPLLPQGTTMKLESIRSEGNGKSTIRTDAILPVSSNLEITSISKMAIASEGQSQEMTLETKVKMSLRQLPKSSKE